MNMRPKHRRYDFHITADDLAVAIPEDSGHCAIADGIGRELPGARAAVDLQTITFTDPQRGERLTYLTPPIAQDHLVAFDQGLPLQPFAVTLRKPIQIRVAGGGSKGEPSEMRRSRERNERLAELRRKRDAGVAMTAGEKVALTTMEKTGERAVPRRRGIVPDSDITALPTRADVPREVPATDGHTAVVRDRSAAPSDARARVLADETGTQIHGGRPPRAAVLSNRRGRVRRYGLRQLKPRAEVEAERAASQ